MDDDVIVIPEDTTEDTGEKLPGLSRVRRLTLALIAYLTVGLAPLLLLTGLISAVGAWMINLGPQSAPSAWVLTLAPWLPAVAGAPLIGGFLVGLVAVAWGARDTPSRIAGVLLLLVLHGTAASLGSGVAAVGAVVTAQQPKVQGVVRHPSTPARRATVLRDDSTPCGWSLYESQGVVLQGTLVQRIDCACNASPDATLLHMPPATARWSATGPVLVDAGSGQPYQCAAPRSTCAHVPGGGSALLALAALLIRRRRAR